MSDLEKRIAEISGLEVEFNHYCYKVRGWLCLPKGILAVIIWEEFREWRKHK